ncbi:MAG TPA: beta-ketoacyl-ACP synthase III, partial [Candidatus Limnocylindrales bacterium]|nr:beta-ketoacyl-ACP synthase III [Candidatus Limnocylindrales bacterium]
MADLATRAPGSVRITGWGMYAPPDVLTNADLEQLVDTSDAWIVERTGIRERHIARPEESTATMAAIAGRRALAVAGLEPDELDLIVVPTLTADHRTPSAASLVKEGLGSTRAAAVDIGAACSGFPYGYALAHGFVAAGLGRHVLVVAAETLSRFTDFTDRGTCVLLGDGAGAVVLSASDEPGGGLLGLELTDEPEGAYSIWQPAGGSRFPLTPAGIAAGEQFWHMDGRDTYRHATRQMAATARAALERARIGPDEVSLFIPHQANLRIIETVAKQLDLPMERVFVNIDRYGNTSAASVPLALAEAVAGGRVRIGDKLCLLAFGAGFTSGALVLEWTADPARDTLAGSVDPTD